MFEYEKVTDGITGLRRDFRGSSYLTFSLYPSENVTLISTTYYQPLINQVGDYRISSENSLVVGLFKSFSLEITYLFIYAAFAAVGIPRSQYALTTGVAYSFD